MAGRTLAKRSKLRCTVNPIFSAENSKGEMTTYSFTRPYRPRSLRLAFAVERGDRCPSGSPVTRSSLCTRVSVGALGRILGHLLPPRSRRTNGFYPFPSHCPLDVCPKPIEGPPGFNTHEIGSSPPLLSPPSVAVGFAGTADG